MSRNTYSVCISYDEYVEFEKFLYDQLEYPDFGYTRMASGYGQVYILDLEESDIVLISLRYADAVIKTV